MSQPGCCPFEHVNSLTVLISSSAGKCLTLNGVEIKSGEWKAIDDCKLNCTCSKSGDSEYLNCDNWCEIERTVCNEGDAMSKTEYFEEVGTSGCKRCITKACDAIS